ncbi:hypothetical protein A3F59_02375 [Candidatus Roizmanbacteria bacterium RIFCSPHIGHO2_12_FULL_38_13]|nr:MAG: hypothetical protein A3F59_02375 [Candidatus Roizmanbacteria bacterium RIFCSPHIGHO2_12_FULL_38_13]
MGWSVYILKCSDDSLYTGITTDINRRITEHNAKTGAKSLYGKLPVHLVYIEKSINQKTAVKREGEIKGWLREKKINLVKGSPQQ